MSTVSMTTVRSSVSLPAALVSIAVTAALLAAGAWGDPAESNPTRRFVITLGVAVACAIPVFGWAVPRAWRLRKSNTAIVLGVLALLSLPVYWLGPTLVLAAGAVVAGLGGSRSWSAVSTLERAAIGLGSTAALAFIVVTFVEFA